MFSINQLEESMQNESKRTSGDKHETERAKMQAEQASLQVHLKNYDTQLSVLKKIDPTKPCVIGQTGALINTSGGQFYLALGIGKIKINDVDVYVVSIVSPIGHAFSQKSKGDLVVLNNNNYQILDIS